MRLGRRGGGAAGLLGAIVLLACAQRVLATDTWDFIVVGKPNQLVSGMRPGELKRTTRPRHNRHGARRGNGGTAAHSPRRTSSRS
jgi:hypothetical protein